MLIADSQVHIWAASTPQRPWPKGHHAPHRPVPFSKDDLLREMDAAGVSRAVIVPPSWEGDRNDLALEAARLHPQRLAVMGRIDDQVEAPEEVFTNWRKQPGMLGFRFTFSQPAAQLPLIEGRVDWLWPKAERAGLPVMLFMTPQQLPLIERIAARHPGLKIAIDHMVRASGKYDDEAFAEIDQLLALAKYPNVAVKASGMPSYATGGYPYRNVHAYIRRAFDAFGPKRVFWGTDLTKLPCTYRQSVTMFTEELPWLNGTDQEWVMGRGLCEWLGWKLP